MTHDIEELRRLAARHDDFLSGQKGMMAAADFDELARIERQLSSAVPELLDELATARTLMSSLLSENSELRRQLDMFGLKHTDHAAREAAAAWLASTAPCPPKE